MGGIGGGSAAVAGELRRLFAGESVAGLGDRALLARFVAASDPAAFEALVIRHGPMVLGVCGRILPDPHDVDDAFQATFLVLVRKARTLRDGDHLGPWLHGVALRVARRSRATSARRKARERAATVPEARPDDAHLGPDRAELRAAIDEEIGRLPDHHRRPVVLCDVEGLSREEAAAQLGWSLNMVRGRLERARDRLRVRLSRRGLAPSGAWVALTSPAVPSSPLVAATSRAAVAVASGRLGADLVSASAVALSRGVSRMMILSRWKLVAASVLATGTVLGVAAVPGLARVGPPVANQEAAARPRPVAQARPVLPPLGPLPDPNAPIPSHDVRVSGVVRDLEGRPVADATVDAFSTQTLYLKGRSDTFVDRGTTKVGTTTTGADGTYQFPAIAVPTRRLIPAPMPSPPFVQFSVVARLPGTGIGWFGESEKHAIDAVGPEDAQGLSPPGTPAVLDVVLRPEADLKGRVVDEDNLPLAGVEVSLFTVNLQDEQGLETTVPFVLSAEDRRRTRAVTDGFGRFRLAGLPSSACCQVLFERAGRPGEFHHASTSAEVATTHPDLVSPASHTTHPVLPRDMTVSLPMPRKLALRVVSDGDGKPAAGIRVSVESKLPSSATIAKGVTDAEGRATLELPAGEYPALSAVPDAIDSPFVRTELRPFAVAPKPLDQSLALRMRSGCEIVVEAVNTFTGQGIPGIRFEIRPAADEGEWVPLQKSTLYLTRDDATGPDGRYRAVVEPTPGQTYRVRVRGTGRDREVNFPYDVRPAESKPFEPSAGKTVDLRFRLVTSAIPRPEQFPPPPDPATVYTVEPIPVRGIIKPRTPEQDREFVSAAAIVAKARPIPDDRIRFFGWMDKPDSRATFAGWWAFVQGVETTPEGQIITLRVSVQARDKAGDQIGIMNNFIEEYRWSEGRLQYLKGYTCPIIGAEPSFSGL